MYWLTEWTYLEEPEEDLLLIVLVDFYATASDGAEGLLATSHRIKDLDTI